MRITKLRIPKISYLRIVAVLLIFIMILSIRGSSNTSFSGWVYSNSASNDDRISSFRSSIMNHNRYLRIRLSEMSTINYYSKANFSLFIISVEHNKTILYRTGNFTGEFKSNLKAGNYYIQIDFLNLTQRIELTISQYGWTFNFTAVMVLTGMSSIVLVVLEMVKKHFI